MATTKKVLLCSPFHKDRHTNSWPTGSLNTNIHDNTSECWFFGPLCKQAATQPAVLHKLLFVRLFWQTGKLGFEIALSAAMSCHNCECKRAEWLRVQSFAKCKLPHCQWLWLRRLHNRPTPSFVEANLKMYAICSGAK